MARATSHYVPAGLQALWNRVAHGKNTRYGFTQSVGAAASVFAGHPDDIQSLKAHAASSFAAWLTTHHAAGLSKKAKSQFFTDRRAELLAGAVNAVYWEPVAVASDSVGWAAPTVRPYTNDWSAIYYDPLRMPSRCTYAAPSLTYPFSEAGTTTAKPLPGWTGAVSGNVFQDLWLAQRRLIFTLPRTIAKADGWPVLAVCQATIQATATVRGNRNWFVVSLEPYFAETQSAAANAINKLHTRWPRDVRFQPLIPEDMPGGWNHSVTRPIVQDAGVSGKWISDNPSTHCGFRIVIPPALGVYFSRNDSVTVSHNLNPAIYLARE